MPLSADEISAARKAHSEIQACEAAGVFVILWCFVATPSVLEGISIVLDTHSEASGPHGWSGLIHFITHAPNACFPLILLGQLFSYYRFKRMYAANLALFREIEQKHAGELPYGLESEIRKTRSRALLWRLDAFLSRKKVSE